MARSNYKQPYYSPAMWRKIFKIKLNTIVRGRLVFDRGSAIPKIFTGSRYFGYNGNVFNKLLIKPEISLKKFGEFAITRKPFFYPKKDKKKR